MASSAMSFRALCLLAIVGAAQAFAPMSGGLTLRSAPRAVSYTPARMGSTPPGPQGRGAFDEGDTFELMDGRQYWPADASTEAITSKIGAEDVALPDAVKGLVALGGLGFSVITPFILIKVIGGY
eukprot:CAMPEP_0173430212 /NCGR_PEP_ID=MMETSP1357-20121228/8705_1 /TAXON_ID=77926 /ORGANISM="Hemiselmis rufescens, Strain PCC563" /LENGTH=124 /DNA_ID=CAMNT_0014394517 /DNA_START=21 /DNA_END=395 /DNA_ORIENTATION=+